MIAFPQPPPIPVVEQGSDPLEYVSVSRLKSFLTCRLKFYFEKVAAIKKSTTPSLHFGKAIHAALQHYNKARWRNEDASGPSVIQAFNLAFATPENGETVRWDDAEQPAELVTKGEALLKAFLASNVHPRADKPAGVEVKMHAELSNLALPLLGVIDLVKGNYSTCDYKTVASTPDVQAETWQHELQLTAYSLLIEDATGDLPPENELVFLVKTKTPKVISHRVPAPNQVQRDRFARLVDTYACGVANEHYYPSPGQQCAWCQFRNECQKWTGGGL
jgi:putative RecB family exonuclease